MGALRLVSDRSLQALKLTASFRWLGIGIIRCHQNTEKANVCPQVRRMECPSLLFFWGSKMPSLSNSHPTGQEK